MPRIQILVIFVYLLLSVKCDNEIKDYMLPLKKLIQSYGYPAELHRIITDDGYVLKTYRIPHGKNANMTSNVPILLNHGLGGCCENFLSLGPNDALAYYLADMGFDVWIFNARGTLFSRKHVSMNPQTDKNFWQFCYDDIGYHDLAKNIDYVLKKTGKREIITLGHSQGSTIHYALTTLRPEYNKKIKLHVAFAPAMFIYESNNLVAKSFARNIEFVRNSLMEIADSLEILPPKIRLDIRAFCMKEENHAVCAKLILTISGHESGLIKNEIIPYIYRSLPGGMSINQVTQFLQQIKYESVRRYDYGPEKNMLKYNETIPPVYDLSKSTVPVAIFYADSDWFSSEKSVKRLAASLPNLISINKVPSRDFGHIDFIYAYNAKKLVYEPLFRFLKNYM